MSAMLSASVKKVAALSAAASVAGAGIAVEEGAGPDFVEVAELQKFGVNAADITKLKVGGFHTVGQVLSTPTKALLAIKGISDTKLEKIMEACKKLKHTGFITGSEALVASKSRIKITTGSKDLDAILGGGIETGTITEVFGEFRSGKSQLAAMLAVTAQLGREHGGGAGKVIYLDTENAFRPERVSEIAEKRFGLDPAAVLDNLLVAKCLTHEHQMEMISAAIGKIVEDEEPYVLLVVDSIIGLFRTEFSGRGELADRQQKLGQHMSALVKMAAEFNVAVLITNQVTADPGNMFVADAKKPVGGNILAHVVQTRIYLRKGKGNNRIARIEAGPFPTAEATFALAETGITDGE